MPQLLPFHFLNTVSIIYLVIILLVWLFSMIILPLYPLIQSYRLNLI